jgi:hypothetical protein
MTAAAVPEPRFLERSRLEYGDFYGWCGAALSDREVQYRGSRWARPVGQPPRYYLVCQRCVRDIFYGAMRTAGFVTLEDPRR